MIQNKYKSSVIVSLALMVAAVVFCLGFLPGCSTLDGEQTANQAPEVWFVNVPPEDNQSSTNPIINWVGQDSDGQIAMYRFIVFTEVEMEALLPAAVTAPVDNDEAQAFVNQVLMTKSVADSLWTYLEVDHVAGEPQTSVIVPMKAEIDNPVNLHVRQFVFVQAFDELDLGSKIIFRAFQRNDNPPDTRTIGFLGGPFINSEFPTGAITGVRMNWLGSDIVDYPTDPPPFEFEWRLYGPYYSQKRGRDIDTLPDEAWEHIVNDFIKVVFVTSDARLFRVGEGLSYEDCDTSFEVQDTFWEVCDTVFDDQGGIISIDCDSTNVLTVVDCELVLIDTFEAAGPAGYLDTILDIADPAFASDTAYNKIAKRSHDPLDGDDWIDYSGITVYDAYENAPSDTTQEMYFVFWVRSRDDAKVPDLTPAYETFSVIDPQYENDIGVVDISTGFKINHPFHDTCKAFWGRVVDNWEQETGTVVNFDPDSNYSVASDAQGFSFSLRRMLSHKTLILVNDNTFAGALGATPFVEDVTTAIDGGVNVWICGRCQIMGGEGAARNPDVFSGLSNSTLNLYLNYMGVENMVYSGWEYEIYYNNLRIEDFVGGLSLNTAEWPDLPVDTALLHSRYMWLGHYPWRPDVAALPEVNWYIRSVGSQAMYVYKSKYGSHHPIKNEPFYDFQGRPIMSRVNRGWFRTVHSLFTPYSIKETAAQSLINNVLTWMYDPFLTAPPDEPRYDDAEISLTADEVSDRYWQRMEDRAKLDPKTADSFR